LVNVPVVLYSAEDRADLRFNMLDSRDHARVRYERVNEITGEEVPWDQIVKGYEYSDGNYVLLSDDDFKKAAVEASQTVEIEDFVDIDSIDRIYFDKPYYLVPGKRGEKGFVLLRETLKRTGKAAIAKVVIRSRQHLAAVVPRGDGMVLMLLRFQQELRDYEEYDLPRGSLKDYKISDKEIKMAEQLVKSMHAEWQPESYQDDYRTRLLEWIEKKVKSDGVEPAAAVDDEDDEADMPGIINIMDLLEKSVKSKQKSKKAPAKKTISRSKRKAKAKTKTKTTAAAKRKRA
jgi:DNA end-binding protein Ku